MILDLTGRDEDVGEKGCAAFTQFPPVINPQVTGSADQSTDLDIKCMYSSGQVTTEARVLGSCVTTTHSQPPQTPRLWQLLTPTLSFCYLKYLL